MSGHKNDSGQALVIVALGMVVLMGFLGLGFDLGFLRYQKRVVQRTADAAAIAGAMMLNNCNPGNTCTAMVNAAKASLAENGYTGTITTVTEAGGACANSLGTTYPVVAINNPPCYMNATADPNYKNNNFVEVVVAQAEPLSFASIFGAHTYTMTVRAEAGPSPSPNTIYALDTAGSPAMSVAFGGITSNGGMVDESTSTDAFSCSIGGVTAPYIGIAGKETGFICAFGNAKPVTGIAEPNPEDPLLYLQTNLVAQAPAAKSCGSGSGQTWHGSPATLAITNTGTQWVLYPATYCGGITIAAGSNVLFNPGVYTVSSTTVTNGGLTINSSATTISGLGVGFYNSGPTGGINFACPSNCTRANIVLTAPNASNCAACGSGWQGILFYQPVAVVTPATIVGTTTYNIALTGTAYLPGASVTYANDYAVNYNILVAKDIVFGASSFGSGIQTFFYAFFQELRGHTNPIKSPGASLSE